MSDDYARTQPKYAWSFENRSMRLLRQLDRHRERYIRAWMVHYGLHPSVCQIVTFPNDLRGEVMRMEVRANPDRVAELVKAAAELVDDYDSIRRWDISRVFALRDALRHFKREKP